MFLASSGRTTLRHMAHSQVQQLRELRMYVCSFCKLIMFLVPPICFVRASVSVRTMNAAAARADDDEALKGPVLSEVTDGFRSS